MGKHDYEKSYERQIECIVIGVCAVYVFTELILGYRNNWNPWGQVAVLGSACKYNQYCITDYYYRIWN